MSCGPVPVPVVNAVEDTVAVQSAPKPRLSMTWTVPRLPDTVVPGAALPSEAVPGTEIDRLPATTDTETEQPDSVLSGGQVLPGSVEATVLSITRVPLSGSLTVVVYVILVVSPGLRSPVQVRRGVE